MKRRDFVSLVSGGLGATAFISCSKEFVNDPSLISAAKPGGGGGGATRYPLRIPQVVAANGQTLICKNAGSMDVGGKTVSNLWSYNDEYPARTLWASRGDNVGIIVNNNLPEETITHWHGMIVDHRNDGGPMHHIAKGKSHSYNFPIVQRAALNWYHPHPHMLTGKQVNLGMAGAFIIRDNFENGLNLPRGNNNVANEAPYEVPLILRDATIDKNGNLSYKPTSGGFNGQVTMVNGIIAPYLTVKRGIYRFRILNGANSRIFGVGLNVSDKLRLIGNDGGLLPQVSAPSRMDISPGERLDVLVDFRGYTDGTKIYLKDLRAGVDLLEFRISGAQSESFIFPSVGSMLATDFEVLTGPATPTRIFSFDGMTKINGLEYNMDRIDWQVPYGVTERWMFKTNGNAPHPVHIHGASFQVISRTGGRDRTYEWEKGWKDTVLLEDSETVEVFIRFDGKDLLGNEYRSTTAEPDKGKYLMHCHKLEHEDLGMMANFEVI